MVAKLKLTPDAQRRICDFVQAGVPIPQAASAAGFSWNTVKDWLKKGREGKKPFVGFLVATQEAKAKWVAAATMRITKAGAKSWKADAWLLERRLPHQFGRRQALEHSGGIAINTTPPPEKRITLLISDPEKARAFFDAVDDDDDTDSA